MRDARERFEAAGATVVLIGLGDPDDAMAFCAQRAPGLVCTTSPDRSAHAAFGLRRGSLNQVAGPKTWTPWLRAQASRDHQGRFGQGDVAQLGGTFVVDTASVVRYAHVSARSSDNPQTDEVLTVVTAIQKEVEEAG